MIYMLTEQEKIELKLESKRRELKKKLSRNKTTNANINLISVEKFFIWGMDRFQIIESSLVFVHSDFYFSDEAYGL